MLDKYKVLRTAERYFIDQKFGQAIHEYKRLIESEGEDPNLLNTLGDIYLREGRRQEAIACFQKVAETYLNSGFIAKATAMYKKVHHLNPSDSATVDTLVDLFVRQSLKSEAVELLMKQVERHAERGESETTWNCLAQIFELDPHNAEVCYRAGQLQEQLNDLPEATRYFQNAARLFQNKGDLARAYSAATACFRISKDDFESRSLMGEVGRALAFQLRAAGEEVEAEKIEEEITQAGLESIPVSPSNQAGEETFEQGSWNVAESEPLDPQSFDLFDVPDSADEASDSFAGAEEVAGDADGIPLQAEEALWEGSLEEALQEADFYLKLGLHDEARKLLTVLVREYPQDERVVRRAEKANVEVPEIESSAQPEREEGNNAEGFELELESALNDLFSTEAEQIPEEVLRYDVVANGAHFEQGNPKVHYDLGLAYKEMGLLEDAIQKFEVAYQMLNGSGHNPQKILCCSMLANSFLQLEDFEKAAKWAQEGLELPGKKDFEWKALQYDYCCALEKLGENERALQGFQQLLDKDASYRDVPERVGRQ